MQVILHVDVMLCKALVYMFSYLSHVKLTQHRREERLHRSCEGTKVQEISIEQQVCQLSKGKEDDSEDEDIVEHRLSSIRQCRGQ